MKSDSEKILDRNAQNSTVIIVEPIKLSVHNFTTKVLAFHLGRSVVL